MPLFVFCSSAYLARESGVGHDKKKSLIGKSVMQCSSAAELIVASQCVFVVSV